MEDQIAALQPLKQANLWTRTRLGVLCALAWLGSGLLVWLGDSPVPRGIALREVSKLGHALCLSGDGHYVATFSEKPSPPAPIGRSSGGNPLGLTIWDIDSGEAHFTLEVSQFAGIALSPGANRLAVRTDGYVDIWDTATGELQEIQPADFFIFGMAFSADGEILATFGEQTGGEQPREIRLWDIDTGIEMAVIPWPGSVERMAFSPDGHKLAITSGPYPTRAHVFDWGRQEPGVEIQTMVFPNNTISGDIMFAPSGQTLALMHGTREIFLSDPASGEVRGIWETEGIVRYAAFSPDSRLLAVSCTGIASSAPESVKRLKSRLVHQFFPPRDRTVLLDAQTGRQVDLLPESSHLAFRPEGKTLVTYSRTNDAVLFWDVPPRPRVTLILRTLSIALAIALTGIYWYRRRAAARHASRP
jgi:WD40 repeat protein